MLSYEAIMPNTKSAKKAVRSSAKKRQANLFWKKRAKASIKTLEKGITEKAPQNVVSESYVTLQKVLDKASKNKVLHKNKVNRLKSKYARIASALSEKDTSSKKSKSGTKSKKAK
jgi:small subunit ribosomal protein S20